MDADFEYQWDSGFDFSLLFYWAPDRPVELPKPGSSSKYPRGAAGACPRCGVAFTVLRLHRQKPVSSPHNFLCPTCTEWARSWYEATESLDELKAAIRDWDEEYYWSDSRGDHYCGRCGKHSRRRCRVPIWCHYILTYAAQLGLVVHERYHPIPSEPQYYGVYFVGECGPCRHKYRKLRKKFYELIFQKRELINLQTEIRNAKRKREAEDNLGVSSDAA